MPTNKSAIKRLKTSEKAKMRNKSQKRGLKTIEKKIREAVASSDLETAGKLLKEMDSKLDKAGKKRVIHPNTASRKKSQINLLVASASTTKNMDEKEGK